MSKSIKLSGTFRTVGVTPTPTHDRPRGALDAGPGSSWVLSAYHVYSRAPGSATWEAHPAHPTFEDAEDYAASLATLGGTYRIVRSTGTCEVVA